MALDPAACKAQAMALLVRREHSRKELERKLSRREYAESVIRETLDELEQSGALAAPRFVESFVRSRIAKGQGPERIRMELKEHAIDAADYRALIQDHDWLALAREVRLKRFGPTPPENFKERARQMRFLQYRGFELTQINGALDLEDVSD